MIAKLNLRCFTKKVYEPFIRLYPKLNKKWVKHVWDLATVIEGDLNDPDFQEFLAYLRTKVDYIFCYIIRQYTKKELYGAELLTFYAMPQFEPTGEEVGTQYSLSCEICRGGRIPHENRMILNLSKIPKSKDIAQSIASDEWIVSERVKSLMERHKINGAELWPVEHWKKTAPLKKWFYLKFNSVVKISDQTTFGEPYRQGPLTFEQSPKSSCGHAIETGNYSEYYLQRKSWDKSDIVRSDWYIGSGQHLIYPSPEIFISQRFYAILRENNIKGFEVEVARLV